ncbi:Proteasome subunit alpha type-3 [Castilleja foliolosa]|uniref:Proteasome subunit alpha type-3 n=1 Tax=Castilleja foliolosa TaxID=1961234 RepID=A0ABD3DSY2_9LAMI
MAVISSLQTNPHSSNIYTVNVKPTPPSLLFLRRHLYRIPRSRRRNTPNGGGYLVVRSYMEESNTFSGIANKIIGSLPVIGLVVRIFSDEGGVGRDVIDFAEFRRRVGNKCSVNDSRALFELQDRRGKAGDPLYVLLCCWVAAVGAGLLKSEEILEGVLRLRISNDIEFEEENFIAMMKESIEKREKLNVPLPTIPMEVRAEKALEAIYVCSFGQDFIEEEDEELLSVILNSVFPTVGKAKIESIVKEKAKRVADGTDEIKIPEPKPLPKEAVQMQMKDLQFLQKGGDRNTT